jgi:hypothetical protein
VLRLISISPDFFAQSGRGAILERIGFGCCCGKCNRAISAPFGYEKKLVWCLYCGMEEGYVPMVETCWGHRYTFGVTREECLEEFAWLERGAEYFHQQVEARTRRYGQVIDLFE